MGTRDSPFISDNLTEIIKELESKKVNQSPIRAADR